MIARTAESPTAEVLDAWRRDFDVIYRDVQDLAAQRYIYREIRKVLEASEERFAHMDGTIFKWLAKMHTHSAAVAVRKQVETDRRTVSLRRLLEAMQQRPQLLSRAAYVGRAGELPQGATARERDQHAAMRQHLEARFDGLAGVGAWHVVQAAIREDLERLKTAATRVEAFVQSQIAHRDRSGLGSATEATWEDLNEAIDLLEALMRRYNELLGADHPPRLVPVWQSDWKAPLRIPWIP